MFRGSRSSRPSVLAPCALALAAIIVAGSALPAQEPAPSAAPTRTSGGLQTGFVAGTVRDAGGVAVAGAQVSLVGLLGRGSSGSDGSFRLSGPVGQRTLVVRRLGFRPESLAVAIVADTAVTVAVRLQPAPQTIATVVVEASRPRYSGRLAGFNQRRDQGFGRYFTGDDIDKMRPNRTTDVLRRVPGLQVVTRGAESFITLRRPIGAEATPNRVCTPLIWIDGAPALAGYLSPDNFDPKSLAGIEVYSGPATVPMELMGPRGEHACGVIAMWTRMAEPRPRTPRRQVTAQELANLVSSLRLYTAEQVDTPAVPDAQRPLVPAYPDSLFRAGIDGRVLVEFVVDTSGVADMETFGEVLSTHLRFTDAVRVAVRDARFTPAVLDGRRVRQLVQLPFHFVVGGRANEDHQTDH